VDESFVIHLAPRNIISNRRINVQKPITLLTTLAGVFVCAGAVVQPAGAATIGLNFHSGAGSLASTDLAGAPGYEQTRWNNLAFASNGTALAATSVVDSDNNNAGSVATNTVDRFAASNSVTSTANGRLMNGFIYQTGSGGVQITLSNLPASLVAGGYSLVLYFDTSNSSATNTSWKRATIDYGNNGSTDLTTHYYSGTSIFNGTFVQSPTDTSTPSPSESSNYLVIGSQAASVGATSFKLTLTDFSSTSERGVISALQIVPVPEPATLGLCAAGTMLLLRQRRRQVV
jgi:hypothetical protein